MKHIVKDMALRLTAKYIDDDAFSPICIKLNSDAVSYFNLSSNRIISFIHDGQLCYFRECPQRRPFKAFFADACISFFDTADRSGISKEHFKQKIPIRTSFDKDKIVVFKRYIEKKFEDKGFIKRLADTDRISEACGFSIWNSGVYDGVFFERFDMKDVPEGTEDIAVYFLWYMRAAAADYRRLNIAKSDKYSFFNAVRSVSSRILAEELGMERMITTAKWCVLEIGNGKKLFGVLSDSAPGSRMADSEAALSGSLQRELLALNVLDALAYQPDHGPNNYNIHVADGNVCSVCAFDNDNPRTFFLSKSVSASLAGCSPLVKKDGMVARPYFDAELALRLKNTDIKALKKRLAPYLNFLQIRAIISRLKLLNRAIEKTKRINSAFLLNAADWSVETAKEEMSGEFGTTYLTKALKK